MEEKNAQKRVSACARTVSDPEGFTPYDHAVQRLCDDYVDVVNTGRYFEDVSMSLCYSEERGCFFEQSVGELHWSRKACFLSVYSSRHVL